MNVSWIINVTVYFWSLTFTLFYTISLFMSVLHYFYYCTFLVSFKIRKCESSKFALFQDCFGYLAYCGSSWTWGWLLHFWKRGLGILIGIELKWHPTPIPLPGKSHGRKTLVGCSPWGRQESDTTERRHFHFSLSCVGEGHGNPLQCSCPENPRDRGAWWAAIYGVAQSRTRLKRLSSSSSSKKSEPTWVINCTYS